MSKNPKHTNEPTTPTSEQVKEVVAETVQQLVTTAQEKPAEAPATEEVKLPEVDMEKVKTMNVSQTIRYLFALGYTRGQIVKVFPKVKGRTILYQHVRNVLVTPVKVTE
jgi:hypothetical protein